MKKQIESIINEMKAQANNISRISRLANKLMRLAGGTALGYFIACVQIAAEDFDGDDFYIKWMIDDLSDAFEEIAA